MGTDETIRVSSETEQRLDEHRDPGESIDDVLTALLDELDRDE